MLLVFAEKSLMIFTQRLTAFQYTIKKPLDLHLNITLNLRYSSNTLIRYLMHSKFF